MEIDKALSGEEDPEVRCQILSDLITSKINGELKPALMDFNSVISRIKRTIELSLEENSDPEEFEAS